MNYRQLSRNLKDKKALFCFLNNTQYYQMWSYVIMVIKWHCLFVIKYVRDATKPIAVLIKLFVIPYGLGVRSWPLKLAHFIYGWAFDLTSIKFCSREYGRAMRMLLIGTIIFEFAIGEFRKSNINWWIWFHCRNWRKFFHPSILLILNLCINYELHKSIRVILEIPFSIILFNELSWFPCDKTWSVEVLILLKHRSTGFIMYSAFLLIQIGNLRYLLYKVRHYP